LPLQTGISPGKRPDLLSQGGVRSGTSRCLSPVLRQGALAAYDAPSLTCPVTGYFSLHRLKVWQKRLLSQNSTGWMPKSQGFICERVESSFCRRIPSSIKTSPAKSDDSYFHVTYFTFRQTRHLATHERKACSISIF